MLWFEDHDLILEEETEAVMGDSDFMTASVQWTASVDGRLYKGGPDIAPWRGGPHVRMSRTGRTAEDAVAALALAIRAQGWEVR